MMEYKTRDSNRVLHSANLNANEETSRVTPGISTLPLLTCQAAIGQKYFLVQESDTRSSTTQR